jgi:DNA adenine methylase
MRFEKPNQHAGHFVRVKEKSEIKKSSSDVARRICIAPFLKWPGGKRWIATQLAELIAKNLRGRYFEPFLGGGAVFFCLAPRIATLSDINHDLINTYIQVRNDPELLIKRIKGLEISKEKYLEIRDSSPECPIERAVRFLYLNRTGFGGIYRLNSKGQFNVPYGGGERTPDVLWEKGLLSKACRVLRNRRIGVMDFEEPLGEAGVGDVVYCDPTYTVAHNYNGFVRYNEKNFSWEDQKRLAQAAMSARSRGALVIVSNAGHESILDLYPEPPLVLERNSLVSRNISSRTVVREYLFVLSPRERSLK